MQALIIDTDPGVDDAMAIAFALAHPDLELLALTTVFGNVSVEQATQNALSILDYLGAEHIPVAAGAAIPIEQKPLPHPDFVHGADGLGNINLPQSGRQAHSLSAAEFIVKSANDRPGEISLVAIGPMTNVQLALQIDPLSLIHI